MTSGSTELPAHRALAFRLAALLLGSLLALLMAEGIFRVLPVATGVHAMPVDESNPLFHFQPDQDFVWSIGWNFETVNRGRTNHQGFVNDQDYDPRDPRPLLAVVGDSYVEALMVPYDDTVHGRLAHALAARARVYSFAASGAPLSQYLAWARHARDTYQPRSLAVVVVGNDFDESLSRYRIGPGFHQYVATAGGALELRRFDYRPGGIRRLLRRSALARYLVFNLHAEVAVARLLAGLVPAAEAVQPRFVGNTDSDAGNARVADSKAAVDAFLSALPEAAGVPAGRIAFLVDADRAHVYMGEAAQAAVAGSYFVVMRDYFMARAVEQGFEVVDMDPTFRAAFAADGRRFEFESDAHWNARGHEVAAGALARTRAVAALSESDR